MAALGHVGDKQELEGHTALGMSPVKQLSYLDVLSHLSQVLEVASKTVLSKLQKGFVLLHDLTPYHTA